MANLTSPLSIKIKGFLFLVIGTLGTFLILIEAPSIKVACLLAVVIWSFCRFYYFAFYVIEHYVDSTYRFSGLLSFMKYVLYHSSHKTHRSKQHSSDHKATD